MAGADGAPWRSLVRGALLHRAFQLPLRLVYAPLRRSGRLPKRWWVRLPVVGTFAVDADGRRIRYSSAGEYLGRVLFWGGAWRYEPTTARTLFALAPGCGTFFDVGAYTGWFTLVVAAANPGLELRAFEPIPRNRRMVAHNLRLNRLGDRAAVVEAAVSEAAGRTTFYESGERLPPSTSSFDSTQTQARPRAIEVETVTLDGYCESSGLRPDLVKIDAEGAEATILRGAERTLREARPVLLLEVLERDAAGAVTADLLAAYGYRLHPIGEAGSHGRNVLAWPPEKAAWVEPHVAALDGG